MEKIRKISKFIEAGQIGSVRIEIIDNKRITIEGCYGICEYTEEFIKINLPKGTLSVFGGHLQLSLMKEKDVTLEGKISSIEFEGDAV
jgi:sporulation protein YqfC